MTNNRKSRTWDQVCEALWGEYWIEPAAEVLGCNRRTVERWRSGAVEIPAPIRAALESINHPDRALGWALRARARPDWPLLSACLPTAAATLARLREPWLTRARKSR